MKYYFIASPRTSSGRYKLCNDDNSSARNGEEVEESLLQAA
jgi:hypothetical protein